MPIIVEATELAGVKLVKPYVFEDHRGRYIETYNARDYRQAGIDVDFVQDDISVSRHNVLRGIHGDSTTWKLISCLQGSFYLVVLNYDRESEQFGKWLSFSLSEHNNWQVLVPPRFGNGHLVTSERAVFHYKQSTYYCRESQFTVKWNDPRFNIWWPTDRPILSQRDQRGE
ncbi:MAG: dTDP-4-dehydrorhamnose 3,5-epimerase family protein [Negativicutes bacterium]|nr:dTDP-4-dehydrorhamnose 3,5-epimerase family protein [Negativicutes bacterium]